MKTIIVTGSGGLVGSETSTFFHDKGYRVIGIDNDMRAYFFGTSTNEITNKLKELSNFVHHSVDIRDIKELDAIFELYSKEISIVTHCAAQPSHDWACKEPLTDFSVNATGTINMLEMTRKHCPKASFIFMSTNKVYGDNPNKLPIVELDKRYDCVNFEIDESMSIDSCKHSIFGASKVSADIMVQEYGLYFGMNTVVFRGGCITGPAHQGAELHGFLSYLVNCIYYDKPYKIYGYKGKQVRDNIHSYDLVNAFWNYHNNPRPGAVYNMGGGRENSISILEGINKINSMLNKNWKNYTYIDENRPGDHIWYISSIEKFKTDYPTWNITYSIDRILREIISSCIIKSSVITSNLKGGVGNQLFQIAIAYSIAKRTGCKLKFLRNQFDGCRQGSHPDKYYGSLFKKIDFVDSLNPNYKLQEREFRFTPLLLEMAENLIYKAEKNIVLMLDGFFQSYRYFFQYKKDVRDFFTPDDGVVDYLKRNSNVFEAFPELRDVYENKCFIGVRRGDYITHSDFHQPCGMSYYNDAIKLVGCEKYYILSDDMDWCKSKFVGENFVFLTIEDDLIQLLVSTLFKNYIISNSTFYWWGSFLSIHENPRIYAPDKWINIQGHESVYRDDMTILERPIEI